MQVVKECLPPQPQPHGKTHLVKHKIRIKPDATPVTHKLRRMSPKVLTLAIEEAKKWLKLGIIEVSNSSWCSAPVMVPRNDTYRMCVDYRDLNKVTEKDAYPLPYLDSALDKLRRAKYLSKIDLSKAFFTSPARRRF